VSSSHLFSPLVFSTTSGFFLSLFLLLFLCSFSFFSSFFLRSVFSFFSDIRIHEKTLSESCFRGVLADFLFFFAPRLFLRREVQGQNRKTNKPKHIEGRRKRKKTGKEGKKTKEAQPLFCGCVSFFLLPLFPAFFSSSSLFLCGSLSDVGGVFLFSSSSLPFFVPTCAFFVLFLFFLKLERHKNADKGAKKKRVCEERKEESTFSFLPLIFSK